MDFYKRIILAWQDKISNIKTLNRDVIFFNDYLKLNKIITFTGPRRAWKTYFMFHIIKKLINQNLLNLEQIIFLDFTNFLLDEFSVETLLESYYELYPKQTPFFIFDEIQELKSFNKSVMYLYNKDYKIFLSWSNSKLLSNELSTVFRGRTIEIKIFPLNFNEFLNFKKERITDKYTEKWIGKIKNLITEYLTHGAYPEVVLTTNNHLKLDLIKNYFELLLYKDLLERYWIENEYVIKYLIKKLLLTTTKEFNINKTFNELKSQNIKVSKQTLYNYLEYLKNIFFIKEITDKYKAGNKKFYFYDISYNNIIFAENNGQRFENIIFTYLHRKYETVKYIKTKQSEIDFIVPSQDLAIQVCYDLNQDNYNREIKSLENCPKKHKYLIYFSQEQEFNHQNINIVSLIDFMDIF